MTPVDNGLWTEGDAAAGVAWLGVVAAYDGSTPNGTSDREESLALAHTALRFLEAQTLSPLYECIMPQGALAAARMNAEHGTNYNVTKMLEFTFSNGKNQYRKGWGMLGTSTWGSRQDKKAYDVGGLIGSITDGGGYAFLGNGLWNLAVLAPIPRYKPQYGRILAKWIYNLANSYKYFFGDQPELQGRQSNPHDKWDKYSVVGYEGLRRCDWNRTVYPQRCLHGSDFGPFATGDWCELVNCDNIAWDCQAGLPCEYCSLTISVYFQLTVKTISLLMLPKVLV